MIAAHPLQADAQEGSGLYEPFPGPVTEERAVTFVQTLVAAAGSDSRRTPVDAARLREGFALDPAFEPSAAAGPTARAVGTDGAGGSLGVPGSIAVLAALACAALVARRVRA